MCALEQQSRFLWRMSLTSPRVPRTGSVSIRTDVNALTNKPCRGTEGQRDSMLHKHLSAVLL